jgi:hypothetical protein
MHTSYPTFFLFWTAIVAAALAQSANYLSAAKRERTPMRKIGFGLGLTAALLSAIAGYRAAINWATLPTSPEGLRDGQLWDDGGIPAIVHEQPSKATPR